MIFALLIRMQPWLASVPSTDVSLLPWIPTSASPPAKVSRASEWPDSPYAYGPYTVFGSGALRSTRMKYVPVGVGVAGRPTATVSVSSTESPLKTVRRCALSSTVIRNWSCCRATSRVWTHPAVPFGRTGSSTLSHGPTCCSTRNTSSTGSFGSSLSGHGFAKLRDGCAAVGES